MMLNSFGLRSNSINMPASGYGMCLDGLFTK